jgi:hypothetical protein
MRLSARVFGFFLATIILFFTAKVTFAQTSNTLPTSVNYASPNNLNNFTQNLLLEVLSSATCQITGINYANQSQDCLGVDPKTGKIGVVKNGGGAIGVATHLIASLYTPPVHSYDYTRYVASNFGIVKSSYAQQFTGLTTLSPVVKIWVQFRNLVYLVFVVIFAIIGMAIMLRVRIDPRTVMTVQNQIPKIIIGLILVTLSLAIAGFLIDIMWVSTYLAINILLATGISGLPADIPGQLYNNALSFVNFFFGSDNLNTKGSIAIGSAVYNALNPQVAAPTVDGTCDPTNPLNILLGCLLSDIFAVTVGPIVNAVLTGILSFFLGLAAFFIISVAILWSMVKLWFALLKAYIVILFTIVLGPIWIVAGLIPGNQSMGFGNWIRQLLGNLMAFPAVIAFFVMGKLFVTQFDNAVVNSSTDLGKVFIPPLIGGGLDTDKVGVLIGIGIILASPHIVEMTKKAFATPQIKTGGYEGLSTGQAILAGGFGGATGRLFRVNPNNPSDLATMGAGTRFMHQKVNNRATRFVFGFGAQKPAETVATGTASPRVRPGFRRGGTGTGGTGTGGTT